MPPRLAESIEDALVEVATVMGDPLVAIDSPMMVKKGETQMPSPRRLGVAEAKSKLSELLRDVAQGPTVIHCRGRDLAVVLAIEDYERLMADQQATGAGGAAFLQRVEGLRQRYGGGVDFEPERLDFVPADPICTKKERGV